jgi:hypothetical protein
MVLHAILDLIPPHRAAHGFFPGRSLFGFAAPHCGRTLVLRLDLESFFASVTFARVVGTFLAAERTLAALCTHRAPAAVRERAPFENGARPSGALARPQAPGGAPSAAGRADVPGAREPLRVPPRRSPRGGGRFGGRSLHPVRRRSGVLLRRSIDAASAGLPLARGRIALEEGFPVQFRKTRFARAGAAQRLAGLVVNERLNVRRREFDRLKGMLHRVWRHGPALERMRPGDRRAQLLGRVEWVAQTNSARGARLRAMLSRIDWPRE